MHSKIPGKEKKHKKERRKKKNSMNFIIGNGVIDGFGKLPRLVEYSVVFSDHHRMVAWRIEEELFRVAGGSNQKKSRASYLGSSA